MKGTLSKSIAEILGPTSSGRLVLSVGEVARAYGCSASYVQQRYEARTLAHLRIGGSADGRAGRILIVDADAEVLDPHHGPDYYLDGRDRIRCAWPGRTRLRVTEVAEALGIHPRTMRRLVTRGDLRSSREGGWHWLSRARVMRWLLACRVPTVWEARS